jgi:16S rRNA (guanine966-N2)-methyltransferase
MIDKMKSKQKQHGIKLRIIGGDMGGRTVSYHGANFTRPMKDNIRENLFNIIGPRIRGTKCFDLFAGTGALALEAISRGAGSAVMVEQNRSAAKWITQTAETLGVSDKSQVIVGDTFRLHGQLLSPPSDDTPWCVFLCPPYAMWTESLNDLNRMINQALENGPPGSILVAETEKVFDANKLPPGNWDLREYGGTRLAFIELGNVCGMTL